MHELVQKLFDDSGLGKEYKKFIFQEAWKEMVPKDILDSTLSIYVSGTVLFVEVRDSESGEVLESLKNEILSRIQKKFPTPPILSVKITICKKSS